MSSQNDFSWNSDFFPAGKSPARSAPKKGALILSAGLLLLSLFFGCAKGSSGKGGEGQKDVGPEFDRTEKVSVFGRAERFVLSPIALEVKKKKAEGSISVSLPIPSEYGVTVIKMNDQENPGVVALSPKILFKSNLNGEPSSR